MLGVVWWGGEGVECVKSKANSVSDFLVPPISMIRLNLCRIK
jgi:hypothetical protein